jgi:serine/threonine-protein kinase
MATTARRLSERAILAVRAVARASAVNCPHCGAPNSADARFCGRCGRATSSTEPSSVPGVPPGAARAADLAGREIVGRYRLLSKLGEGGMGAVYRGEQISLKRKVAIKLLRPELSADPGLVRRFNSEAELVAKLSHPNTVNIYDFGQDADGTLFIAMEYIEGRSLRAAMTAEGPLPPRRAIPIVMQVAGSLVDAHAHGIIHRDLKPDNVMLTDRGRERDIARVLDFGIAKLREEGKNTVNQMTQAGDLVGTPQYMAPEQIRGDKVDGRTDVYALGALLYEIVTGRLPFEGPTVMAILSKHLTETPPPPSVRRPDLGLPPQLDAVVMCALAKEPEQRTASMELFAEQLAAVLAIVGGAHTGAGAAVMPPTTAPHWQATPGWQTAPPGAPAGAPAGNLATPAPYPPTVSTPAPMAALGPAPMPMPASMPMPAPMPMPASMPMPAPMPHAAVAAPRRTGLWIGLIVVVVGAIGAIAFVATRAPSPSPGSGSGSGSGRSSDDPWSHGNTPPGPAPSADIDARPAPPAGDRYEDPDGHWALVLPAGIPGKPTSINTADGAVTTGFASGNGSDDQGVLVVAATGVDPNLDDAAQMQAASAFAQKINGTLVAADFPTIQGRRRLRAIIDIQLARFEAVLYATTGVSVIVMYGTERDHFDASEAVRRELFERGVQPPGTP